MTNRTLPALLSTCLAATLLACGVDDATISDTTDTEAPVSDELVTGYAPLSRATTWRGLGPTTPSTGLAVVGSNGHLYSFYKSAGTDGRLVVSNTGRSGTLSSSAGGPALVGDAAAAVLDPVSKRVFIAVHDANGRVSFAETIARASGLDAITWTATGLGGTDGPPSLAVGCGRVHVAVRSASQVWVNSRPVSSSTWQGWRSLGWAQGLPALAATSGGAVGLAVRGLGATAPVWFSRRECGGTRDGQWSTPATLGDRSTSDERVGLTAYGPLFGVALRAGDGYPYFLLQTYGLVGPQWPATYELVTSAPLGTTKAVTEAPVATTFRGVIFLGARVSGGATTWWLRNPNSLAPAARGQRWLGGRTVTGQGTAATAPAFATAETYSLNGVGFAGQASVPSELYVVTRGVGDRQLYLTNFSRFVALDVLEGQYKMVIETAYKDNGIAKQDVDNLFEILLGMLRMPTRLWAGFTNLSSDAMPGVNYGCNAPNGLYVYPAAMGGEYVIGCGPDANNNNYAAHNGLVVNDNMPAWRAFEEWGHRAIDFNWSQFVNTSTYATFADLSVHQCGGVSFCILPESCSATFTAGLPQYVCEVAGPSGKRPRGFVSEYSVTSQAHNWIYVALMYRWFGADLRALAAADAAVGDRRLQQKYDAMKVWFDGVEFNGTQAAARTAGSSDESQGALGMPLL